MARHPGYRLDRKGTESVTIDSSMGSTLGEPGNLVAGGNAPSPGWQLDQELRVASGETVSTIQRQAFERMVRAYSAPWRKALSAYRPSGMSTAWQVRINLQTDWLNIVERKLFERGRLMAVSSTKPPAWNAFVVKGQPVVGAPAAIEYSMQAAANCRRWALAGYAFA